MTAPVARTRFLDVDYDPLSLQETFCLIAARDPDAPFGYLVTPNVDHIVRLEKAEPAIRAAYEQAELCLCDSRVVSRLARLVGVELTVVPGSDLVREIMDRMIAPGDRLCLIGGSSETAARLGARHPGVTVLQHSPPMGLLRDAPARAKAIEFAANAHARILLLAVGSPQQEVLAREMREDGRVTGFGLCIGAAVEFITGEQIRAPRIVQKAGMEWAWRLASQPRRLWRRYLVDGPAVFGLVWRWSRAQKARPEK
ncbi:WecB/TagA/CpsF family glycosyltransferase [Sphingomonas sp. MMS24-J13]|uniref:WecB/TagA/CpsF family glycosyltransferase n=1 Tax=Sphingomonas sp. MMS24-J13 TaxID=3238686 RepID=UPI00384BDF86